MRLLILFGVVGCALAAPPDMPTFKLYGYSRSNVPEMSVTFENGVTDDLVLEQFKGPCSFLGKLKNHPGSTAVTGCLKNPGDKMHITMLSPLNTKSAAYELDFDGHLTALENPFKNQKKTDLKAPTSRTGDWTTDNDTMGDEEEDLSLEEEEEAAFDPAAIGTWPGSVAVRVKFGYDNSMAAIVSDVPAYIDDTMTHVQAYYQLPALPTQILFEYDHSETLSSGQDWPSCTDYLGAGSQFGEDDNDPTVDLYAWFVDDPEYWGVVGVAWLGTACLPYYKTSMNEHRDTPTEMAWVLAHELGHNFGMSHDFDDKHGGEGGPCDGTGIMSYGSAPADWSTCSVADFTEHYEVNDWGNTCFDTGESEPPTEVPPTDPGCLEVALTTTIWANEITWTIDGPESCASAAEYTNDGVFFQECCLLGGDYVVTCLDSWGDGWHGGFLEVDGQVFCDDFLSGKDATGTLSLPPAEVTVDITLNTQTWGNEVSWALTSTCQSEAVGSYENSAAYTTTCELVPGEYFITCFDSYGDGWHGGYLEIQGKDFCADFLGGDMYEEAVYIG